METTRFERGREKLAQVDGHGYKPLEQKVNIEAGSESERSLELESAAVIVDTPVKPPPPPEVPLPPPAPSKLMLYAAGGLTLEFVAGATTTGILGIGKQGTFKDDPVSAGNFRAAPAYSGAVTDLDPATLEACRRGDAVAFRRLVEAYQRPVIGLCVALAGSEAGERVIESLKDVLPDLATHIIAFAFGDIYTRPGLDLRSRELATVAALTALGNARPPLEVHLHGALNVGCTRDELAEVILQMSVYAGFTAALNAAAALRTVLAARGLAARIPQPGEAGR